MLGWGDGGFFNLFVEKGRLSFGCAVRNSSRIAVAKAGSSMATTPVRRSTSLATSSGSTGELWARSSNGTTRPLVRPACSPAQMDEAAELYASRWPLVRIAGRVGVTPTTAQRRLRERGVMMRDVRGRASKRALVITKSVGPRWDHGSRASSGFLYRCLLYTSDAADE